MRAHPRSPLPLAAPAALALGLLTACGTPDTDRCAGIDCGANGTCVVVGGAPRCDCALDYIQVGSQCVRPPDGGVQNPCGNGRADDGEVCDGDDLRGQTCSERGFTGGGILGCRPTCDQFDTTGCITTCGDGLAGGTEVCDGTDFLGETCTSQGYYGGDLSCTATCQLSFAACTGRCGDGIVQLGIEACDGTNLAGNNCGSVGYYTGVLACDATCTSLGYTGGGSLACLASCDFDTSGCVSVCGNGLLDTGEQCDDGNTADGDGCSGDCSAGLGRIVFVSDRAGDRELWTMTDDGTNLAQLTFAAPGAGSCLGAHNPRWSPDGSRIAFRYGGDSVSCAGDPTIYVINANGTGLMPVLQAEINGGLTWSRDGSHIVYTAGNPRTLRIVNADGTGDASLYDDVSQELDPDFHPRIDRLAFSRYTGGGDFAGLFAVDTDGTDLTQLAGACTAPCGLQSARWSSNGAMVLYRRDGGIFWVSADGTGEATVLSGGADLFVDWLTDTQVIFQTPQPNSELNVVNIDGTNLMPLTATGGYNGEPDWQPGQRDTDLDGVLDWADNCVDAYNPNQADTNLDGVGNACD
jgi:cysteine-rich repeat protein